MEDRESRNKGSAPDNFDSKACLARHYKEEIVVCPVEEDALAMEDTRVDEIDLENSFGLPFDYENLKEHFDLDRKERSTI